MTISTTQNFVNVAGNGSSTSFQFPFVGDSASDIIVSYVGPSSTQTILSPTQYNITLNAPATNQLWGVGGSVTYPLVGSPIPNGTSLLIQRSLPFTQQTSISNQGNVYPQVVEIAMDTLEMQIQQVASRTGLFRGTWLTNIQYNYGDIVIDGNNGNNTGNYYMCIIANVSGVWKTDLASGDWQLVFNVQGLNTVIGAYLPIIGGTITGNLGVNGTFTALGNVTLSGTLSVNGAATFPTQSSADNSTKGATTAYVTTAINNIVPYTTPPQGRLTLTSNTPVMKTDATAQTTIYYTDYVGNIVPIYNGTSFVNKTFTQISSGLNTSVQLSGNLYDIFIFISLGNLHIGTGSAWATSMTRTDAISQINGIWVNTNFINLQDGLVQYQILANQATYLGTMYCPINGQTQFNIKPTPAIGGTGNVIGLWNAYNRVRLQSICRDSASPYTYSLAGWRQMDGSASNRIYWVDGLGQVSTTSRHKNMFGTGSAGAGSAIGIVFNIGSSTPNILGQGISPTATLADNYQTIFTEESLPPTIGFNYVQAVESALSGVTTTFQPSSVATLILDTEY